MKHPEKLGKYPITGGLGEGAMGVVYKGFDPIIQRPVAIKTIHKQLIGDDPSGTSAAARFRNEAQAVGRLLHPGIVAIYEYGEDDTTAFIAMELVQGRTLSQILESNPKLPEPDVLRIMDQLLAALDVAHHHGVWHRDIKPANILITSTGQLKITDFGIARIESVALTQVTSTIGTPGYMAPEQYRGDAVDHRVDLFSAGVLLYRMLTGEQPFRGSVEAVMYQILHKEPVPPSQVPGAMRPVFYDALVAKALAKDKLARFESAAQFRGALEKRVQAIPAAEAQTTVIVVHAHPPAPAALAGRSATADMPTTPVPSLQSVTVPPGWNNEELTRVEHALASFVGPVAKVLVRMAAKHAGDLAALTSALTAHLTDEQDRQRFLAKAIQPGTARTHASTGGSATARTVPTRAPTPAPAPSGTMAPPLSPADVAHGLKVLTSHIGPIAAIVVKKASAKAPTQEQFFQMLAEHAAEGAERDQLVKALRRKTG
jgi:serine/threonine-protein kinase